MFSRKRLLSLLLCAVMILGMIPAIQVSANASGIFSCVIDPVNPSTVVVQAQVAGGIANEDGQLYLFAVPTYVDSIAGQTPVASLAYTGAGNYRFTVALNEGTAASLLYSKFIVGVRAGGAFTALTGGNFITNPEEIAASKAARVQTSSKKGIHIDFFVPTDMEDLNVKHSFFNISYAALISNTPTDFPYTYNGKTYYFNPVVNEYDSLISHMTKAGMSVTVALINPWQGGYEYLIHPGVPYNAITHNYAVNTSTAQGLETVAAATHFLAERYNGTDPSRGRVENWVFGNEVNDNEQYYYMGQQQLDTFVQEYLQSFRVAYTAIKSAYANANVYICLEHGWGTTDTTLDYGGKNFIDKFNAYATAQGNMDWGLSYHPYSFPLNDADILNDGNATIDFDGTPIRSGMVTNQADSPIVTMKNLQVVTDYFHNSELLSPSGQVRSILLGEQGYTSYSNITGQNEARQAANIALAYYIAEMNPDVDAFLLRGHTDTWEGSDYYKFGLWNAAADGRASTPKKAYEMYRYLDTPDSLAYTEFAKPALNISDWSEVVPGWNPAKLSGLATVTDGTLYAAAGSSGATILAKGMMGVWEPGYHIFNIGEYDYAPSYQPDGVAVANEFAYYLAYQGIETKLSSPVDLSAHRYLTMDVNFKPKDAANSGDLLEMKVRLHSGSNIYDAAGIVGLNQNLKICLDLANWSGRSRIDAVEVLIRPVNKQSSFSGTFTVYNLSGASGVAGLQALGAPQPAKIDLSGANLTIQKSFAHTGNPITPAPTLQLNGQLLTQGQDYDVIYHDNVNAGIGKIVIVGIGQYTGYLVDIFAIQSDRPCQTHTPAASAPAIAPTCLTPGVSSDIICSGCGMLLQEGETLAPLGHDYGLDANGQPDFWDETCDSCGDKRVVDKFRPTHSMYRMYNPNSGEHFYTGSMEERQNLEAAGWKYEGVGFTFPATTGKPVYRLFDPASGEHLYTMDENEKATLLAQGWNFEGIAFNSGYETEVAQYRLHNPNATVGAYHFTASAAERDVLLAAGWEDQGIGWYSCWQ